MLQLNFRVRFGNIQDSVQKSDQTFEEFYGYVGSSIYQQGILHQKLVDIFISTKDALNNNFYNLLSAIEDDISGLINGNEFSFLIHLEDIPKSTTTHAIVHAVYHLLENFPNVKILFLVADASTLLVEKSIVDMLSLGLTIVDFDGNYIVVDSITKNISKKKVESFEHRLSLTQLTLKECFNKKLIKHIGHFQKLSGSELLSCHQYFFDGNKCVFEIGELLYQKISSEIELDDSFAIYYPLNPILSWAESAYAIIDDNFYNNYQNKYKGWIRELTDETAKSEPSIIILLYDVINSAVTLGQTFRDAQHRFPKSSFYHYCTIDCHDTDADISTTSTNIDVAGQIIKVGHLIKEKQLTFRRSGHNCPMCSPMEIKPMPFYEINEHGRLSAFELWTMLFDLDNSLAKEIIGAETGRFKNLLPNTLTIIEKNPGLLAHKFFCTLKENNIELVNSTYLIYPDETASFQKEYQNLKSNAVPSSLFISSLKLMYQYNIFGVPRYVIDEIRKQPEKLDNIENNYPELKNALKRLQTNQSIIIDEFPRTYKTYETILKILEKVGIDVYLYFTLFNFTPSLVKEKVIHTRHLNLYEFEIE